MTERVSARSLTDGMTGESMITVFTPTFNRCEFLPKIYACLCKQTFRHFEWLIVDDGSTDGTAEVVRELIDKKEKTKEGRMFPIRYFHQENGGKHRAINRGVKEAYGELFLILDSDDTLPSDSLEFVNRYYQQIRDDHSFGGVCGYMAHHDGTVIAQGNDDDVLDINSLELRYRYHVKGDMCEVFKTLVLREIPFPEIENEKFCPEALVWNRIAAKYRLRIFHQVIYLRDYLEGGLTDRIVRIRMNSPLATMMTYAELIGSPEVPFVKKSKAAINYWRFRLCASGQTTYPSLPLLWIFFFPLGYLMHIRDKNMGR